jgi:hypothetical protein
MESLPFGEDPSGRVIPMDDTDGASGTGAGCGSSSIPMDDTNGASGTGAGCGSSSIPTRMDDAPGSDGREIAPDPRPWVCPDGAPISPSTAGTPPVVTTS